MSVSVCLCVCLSVRDHIFETTLSIFTRFFVHVTCTCYLCMLPVAVARSSYGGVMMCYVFPVLWQVLEVIP